MGSGGKGDLERRIWKCRWRLNKERLEEKGRKKSDSRERLGLNVKGK